MNTSRTALIALIALGTLSACAEVETPEEAELTWASFRASVYQEPWEGGVFIVNGDETIATEEALRHYFDEMMFRNDPDASSSALIVHRTHDADVMWDNTQKHNLTYCVSTDFGTAYDSTVQAMAQATANWEAAADINFIHLAEQDANCNTRNNTVLFDVRPVSDTPYLARAFFPNDSRRNRNVIINTASMASGLPDGWTPVGILTHNLGHVLGFRHEHTRPESGTCYEDSNWRALTSYDSDSVMHYPHCNGDQTGDLSLTSSDRNGASALYGAPSPSKTEAKPTRSTRYEGSGR